MTIREKLAYNSQIQLKREFERRRSEMRVSTKCFWVTPLIVLLGCFSAVGGDQKMSSFDRDRAKDMLQDISADVQKHYYNPKFHGLDWNAKVSEARQKIETAAAPVPPLRCLLPFWAYE